MFGWLVVGGEETEVRLLAKHLDRERFALEVVACQRREGMPDLTERKLRELGVPVDTAPYSLSFAATVDHLARRFAACDVVVSCQAPPDVYAALERMTSPPPLIEHGGLVSEARGPKHLTTRYVGVCRTIRDVAAQAMAMEGRAAHALEIPSMVDLSEFDAAQRASVRRELAIEPNQPAIGWVGRLDRKKRVEDFLAAAALVLRECPGARFVIIGGPDAFMPEYAEELRVIADALGLARSVVFMGDREDVPRLLAGLDILAWLSEGEGMPHVIAEAGAARLPVVATADNGTVEQIVDGRSGIFVPPRDPAATARALRRLVGDRALARHLGAELRHSVETEFSCDAVIPRWEALLAEVAVAVPAPA
ncbi:MAG: glycosyltransferase family 4 protein [Candidatus Limnocylindria bacterium]